jgi:hypothetical protein
LVVGGPVGIEMPQALSAAWALGSFSWPPIPPGIPLGIPLGNPVGMPLGLPDGRPEAPLGNPVGMPVGIEIPAAERHFRIVARSKPPGP